MAYTKKFLKSAKKDAALYVLGFVSGVANALFGAGGGIFAVTALKNKGLDQTHAQASSVLLMFFLCLVSVILAGVKGQIGANELKIVGVTVPFGLVGAYVGTVLMRKFSTKTLKNIFAVFVLLAGIKFLF